MLFTVGADCRIALQRFGFERRGRTLAIVRADGRDVACIQIAAGHAVYVAKWDMRGVVAAGCELDL